MATRLHRRTLLAAAASSLLSSALEAHGKRDATADAPSLVVAGPAAGEAADWARLLLPAFDQGLMAGGPGGPGRMRVRFWGGQDGVTGLNQFEARVPPGGQDALVFPGSALMAWLIGDPRVAFDGSRLWPLLARVSPGVLMLRGALRARRGPVRLAMAPWSEQALAGFLGLDLLRVATEPVAAPGMEAALQQSVDAVFLHGADVPARCRALVEGGLTPLFAVGSVSPAGMPCRDPAFADVPTLPELLASSGGMNSPAIWSAVAAASVMDLALALPALSSGACVTRWRHAATAAAAETQTLEAGRGMRLLTDGQAAAAVAAVSIDGPSQIALRRWAATRLRDRG
jgi:hypothetical protein